MKISANRLLLAATPCWKGFALMAIDLFSIPVKSLFQATCIDPARSMSCIQMGEKEGVVVVCGGGGRGGLVEGWGRGSARARNMGAQNVLGTRNPIP